MCVFAKKRYRERPEKQTRRAFIKLWKGAHNTTTTLHGRRNAAHRWKTQHPTTHVCGAHKEEKSRDGGEDTSQLVCLLVFQSIALLFLLIRFRHLLTVSRHQLLTNSRAKNTQNHLIFCLSTYSSPSLPPSLTSTFPHRPIRLDHCIQAREHEQRGPQREEDEGEKEGEDGLLIPVAVA